MPPPKAGVITGPVRLHYPDRHEWLTHGPTKPQEVHECSLHGEFIRHGVAKAECYRCRQDREAYTRDRRDAVRKPPRPPFEKTAGVCSMCGGPLPGRRRSWCSDACVDLWMIATTTNAALHHLTQIHGPACWGRGTSVNCRKRSERPPRDFGPRVDLTAFIAS